MIVIWKADYDGVDIREDLGKLHEIQLKLQKKVGGEVEGPYFPQDASVLYIFHVKDYEWLNRAGRLFYPELIKSKLPFVPKSYEVAVTPEEFYGS